MEKKSSFQQIITYQTSKLTEKNLKQNTEVLLPWVKQRFMKWDTQKHEIKLATESTENTMNQTLIPLES